MCMSNVLIFGYKEKLPPLAELIRRKKIVSGQANMLLVGQADAINSVLSAFPVPSGKSVNTVVLSHTEDSLEDAAINLLRQQKLDDYDVVVFVHS